MKRQRVANGFYKHYKGGIYEVVGMSIHTETEEELVLYKDEDDNFWSRPVEMFLDVDNFIPELRAQMPRFEKVMVSIINTKFGYIGETNSIHVGYGRMLSGGGTLFTGYDNAKRYEHDKDGTRQFQEDFDRYKEIGAISSAIHKQK